MKLGIHRVAGLSMAPSFLHNDYVLSFRWHFTRYQKGDVVVVQHPVYGRIIKRIVQLDGQGQALLAGDNPAASTSSEKLGWLPLSSLLGCVWWRVAA
ncbi:MAG: nickel-type superoxide dismutase maturation protease [Marinobacterium sp.]|nr:nickel-type superoxide dismutase maturation protease [Marinobacterium sp.]